jgi:MFS transporter, BCD family, chlorophyll transporter
MFDYKRFALGRLSAVGPRWLPFADVASEEVPLSRLLRLSLFQVTVGMALVLMVGTLNRVMIVELRRFPRRWWR